MARSNGSRPARPTLDLALTRGRTSFRARVARLRSKGWQVGQCAVAAGLAWFIAADLVRHDQPFFAPIAAVVSLGTGYGQRLRRVTEVTVGVAIGVFVGDLLTHALGSGGWQITLIVTLAMCSALLLDAGAILVTQAAVQAIVVSTLLPDPGQAFLRWTDAIIGGSVALGAAAVVPRAPLRRPREQVAVVLRKIAALLRDSADRIDDGDVDLARTTLQDARATDALIAELRAAAAEGLSVLASSPFRWRHRPGVRRVAEVVEPLDFAVRNTRVVARRVAVACYRDEAFPPGYAALLRDLADVADAMAGELRADQAPDALREPLVVLARASSGLERSQALSVEVVLASVRSLIADLLAVSGMDPMEATDQIPPVTD